MFASFQATKNNINTLERVNLWNPRILTPQKWHHFEDQKTLASYRFVHPSIGGSLAILRKGKLFDPPNLHDFGFQLFIPSREFFNLRFLGGSKKQQMSNEILLITQLYGGYIIKNYKDPYNQPGFNGKKFFFVAQLLQVILLKDSNSKSCMKFGLVLYKTCL